MTAPALVALAHGSRDPRSAQTIKALVDEVRAMRPDLRIEPAFLELAKPSFTTVVDRLVKAGYDEIVVVPLLLTEAYHAKVDVPTEIKAATERHPGLRVRATRVLGLETALLEVLDRRLRTALSEARVRELDRELRLLGPINPLALEEFTELRERHSFLEEQLEDRRRALDALACSLTEHLQARGRHTGRRRRGPRPDLGPTAEVG